MGLRQCSMRSAGGVEYELTRKRVKNLNLRFGGDGSVAVSAAPRALAAVDAFVASRAGWIAAAQAKMRRRQAAEAAGRARQKRVPCAVFAGERAGIPLFAGVLGPKARTARSGDMRTRWGSCNVKERRITLARALP